MKSTGPLFLSLALAGGALAAETAHERGQRVVNEALQAVGGKAYLAMEDRVESGRAYSFYRQQLEGLSLAKIYTRYVTPVPGKPSVRERQSFGKDESSGVLFNQEGAWEINFHGARLLEPKRIENWRDGTLRNVFYILRQRLDEPRMDFSRSGGGRLGNQLPRGAAAGAQAHRELAGWHPAQRLLYPPPAPRRARHGLLLAPRRPLL